MKKPSDSWVAGDAYETFMGRWSRQLAGPFLDWLALTPGLNWLDVGCGTGALSQAICGRLRPHSLVGCDPSPDFISFARNSVAACPAEFVVTSTDRLPSRDGGFDAIVSGLVLNFLPQPLVAVQSMRERLHPGGTLGGYVWDYAGGMQFLSILWEEAAALDPPAADLDEARRFPLCHPDRLADLFREASLDEIATTSIHIDTVFTDFDDFWSPLTAGTGPAPSYVTSLDPGARSRLSQRLKDRLHRSPDESIRLTARAFAIRGVYPG